MPRFVKHRARETEGCGISGAGQPLDFRARGVRQTEKFADFIEAFPRSVVDRASEQAMMEFSFDFCQDRVAAAGNERNGRLQKLELRPAGVSANPGGVKMRFMVVNPAKAFTAGIGKGPGHFKTLAQGAGQSRALRRRDGLDRG